MEIIFINLPVYYYKESEEEVLAMQNLLGNKYEPEYEEGFKLFNINHIVSFNKDTDGNTCLGTIDQDLQIPMKYEEFYKLIEPLVKIINK